LNGVILSWVDIVLMVVKNGVEQTSLFSISMSVGHPIEKSLVVVGVATSRYEYCGDGGDV
jgi:hypothetical protein